MWWVVVVNVVVVGGGGERGELTNVVFHDRLEPHTKVQV